MKEEEIIEQLRVNLSAISITNNFGDIYKINAYIFNLLAKLEKVNKQLAEKISVYSVKISNSADLEEIHNLAKTTLAELVTSEKEERHFIPKVRVVKSQEYTQAKIRYAAYKPQIESTEIDILIYPKYEKKLHEPIKAGKYKGCWPARMTGNLRIVYFLYYERGVLIFIDIITKNDFENSMRLKPINWKEKFADF